MWSKPLFDTCDLLGSLSKEIIEALFLTELICQSAPNFDPVSASNFDPFERRVLTVALASSELDGIAETWRATTIIKS